MSKHENICLPGNNSTLQSTSTHETSFLSWATAQKVYNLLPLGIASCESIYEAKMYTVALLAMKKTSSMLAHPKRMRMFAVRLFYIS